MSFDFDCTQCGMTFQDFVKPDVHYAPCPKCEGLADRLISAPRLDFGITGDKWKRTNAKKVAEDKKFFKEHGVDKKHHSYGS